MRETVLLGAVAFLVVAVGALAMKALATASRPRGGDELLARLLARRAAEAMLDELLFWHVGQWFRRGDDPGQAGVPTWDGRHVAEAVDRAVRKVVEEVTRRG